MTGTTGTSEKERKGRKRAASPQDTALGNNPVFASLTKENEGLGPAWLALTVENPLL